MVRHALGTALLLALGIVFSGCPNGQTQNGKNAFTIHNQHTKDLEELSITKVGPVPGNTEKAVNLLQVPVPPGGTFTVSNLADGDFEIRVNFRYRYVVGRPPNESVDENYCCDSRTARQVMEGGILYHWYFDPDRNEKLEITQERQNIFSLLDLFTGHMIHQ